MKKQTIFLMGFFMIIIIALGVSLLGCGGQGADESTPTTTIPIVGILDTDFSSDGLVINDSAAGGSSHDAGNALTLDSSGRILVAGYSYNASDNADMVIWRYRQVIAALKPRSQGYLLLTVIFGLLCQGFASPSAKIKEEKIMPTASCEENIASASVKAK